MGDMTYHVQDHSGGRIYRVQKDIAAALVYARARLLGAPGDEDDRELLRRAHGFVQSSRAMSRQEMATTKPFNPLFMQVPLFDVAPYQQRLRPLANAAIGPAFWIAFFALLFVGVFLASSQNWSILSAFGQIFSLSALASFAVIAPFLKIFHELGHVLTATRFGVTVRNAGVYFISLYPMPFVDCSAADTSASRNQRIAISLAGLFVDLTIALIALILWHFADGGFGKTFLGRIFVFSSINSIIFNANPLIRLDGYFALSDWLGRRNLSTNATKKFKATRRYLTTFGGEGQLPRTREDYALCGYAIGSIFYRINILITIAWLMLPRFFGFGVVLILWAGYLMFLSPLLASPKDSAAGAQARISSMPFWTLFAGILAASLYFIQLPMRAVIPVSPDISNYYAVTATERGKLLNLHTAGIITPGTVIAQLESQLLEQDIAIQNEELSMLGMALDSVSGADPTQAIAVTDRIALAQTLVGTLQDRKTNLKIVAQTEGFFVPPPELERYARIFEGGVIGHLYATTGSTHLSGQFPDRLVDRFNQAEKSFTLRIDGSFDHGINATSAKVVQITSEDLETGERSFKVEILADNSPNAFRLSETYLKINMGKEPLYRHIQLVFEGLRQKYWNARSSQ